jgi:hypothetical protein
MAFFVDPLEKVNFIIIAVFCVGIYTNLNVSLPELYRYSYCWGGFYKNDRF